MSGRCMCGDPECPSCGLAQGTLHDDAPQALTHVVVDQARAAKRRVKARRAVRLDLAKARMVYSPANQAWTVSWGAELLRVFNDRDEAEAYMDELCGKDWRG